MTEKSYVDVQAMLKKLLGEYVSKPVAVGESQTDYFIPLTAIMLAIQTSPQLVVHEPGENKDAYF